jgi:hypothetical protein
MPFGSMPGGGDPNLDLDLDLESKVRTKPDLNPKKRSTTLTKINAYIVWFGNCFSLRFDIITYLKELPRD